MNSCSVPRHPVQKHPVHRSSTEAGIQCLVVGLSGMGEAYRLTHTVCTRHQDPALTVESINAHQCTPALAYFSRARENRGLLPPQILSNAARRRWARCTRDNSDPTSRRLAVLLAAVYGRGLCHLRGGLVI